MKTAKVELSDYQIVDELYGDLKITDGLAPQVHAQAEWNGRTLPVVMTAESGRIMGAGKTVYLANGHDLHSLECPAVRQLWLNAVRWCLEAK